MKYDVTRDHGQWPCWRRTSKGIKAKRAALFKRHLRLCCLVNAVRRSIVWLVMPSSSIKTSDVSGFAVSQLEKIECHNMSVWSYAMYPTYPPGQPILGMGSVSPNVNAAAAAFLWDGRAGYSVYRSAATAPVPEIDYRRRGLMGSAIVQNPSAGDVGCGAEAGACLSQTLSVPTCGSTSLRHATTMSPLHQVPILVCMPIVLYVSVSEPRKCFVCIRFVSLLQLRGLVWVKAQFCLSCKRIFDYRPHSSTTLILIIIINN